MLANDIKLLYILIFDRNNFSIVLVNKFSYPRLKLLYTNVNKTKYFVIKCNYMLFLLLVITIF